MTHSWNGKYRRPKGLATPDYQVPMEGDLLWVYEGLTQYLGDILAPRAGLWTKQQFLDETAETAAALDHTPGRSWRPLQDTADAAQLLYNAAPEFESWRRSVDYYPEGFLIWLEADTVIRQQTKGQKSMNDFCHIFHGGGNTPPKVITYTFDDVVKTLNEVTPYDWAKFLRDRLDTYGPGAPLGGITNSGWKLVYDDNASEFTKAMEKVRDAVDARFSIGLSLDDKGGIQDVIYRQSRMEGRHCTRNHAGGRKRQKVQSRHSARRAQSREGKRPEPGTAGDEWRLLQNFHAELSRWREVRSPGAR